MLSALNLTDVSLVGFSMGTGEVTRYIGKHGTKRVRKAVLVGTLGPYLVKTADNPEGVDRSVFDGIKAAIKADRPALLMDFLRNFYNYDVTRGKLVSERYTNSQAKLEWQCALGHRWRASYNSLRQGSWCPQCKREERATRQAKGSATAESAAPTACCGLMQSRSTPSW